MTDKRFTRSSDKMIFGVCSGLAEYFNIDPTIVRMIFALLFLTEGIGLFIYIILAIIMPDEASTGVQSGSNGHRREQPAETQFEPLGSRDN